jgi:hypothetical protein
MALKTAPGPLLLVVSGDIYRSVIQHDHDVTGQAAFHRPLSADIAGKQHPGWIHIPHNPPNTACSAAPRDTAGDQNEARLCRPARPYSLQMRAAKVRWQVRTRGRTLKKPLILYWESATRNPILALGPPVIASRLLHQSPRSEPDWNPPPRTSMVALWASTCVDVHSRALPTMSDIPKMLSPAGAWAVTGTVDRALKWHRERSKSLPHGNFLPSTPRAAFSHSTVDGSLNGRPISARSHSQ